MGDVEHGLRRDGLGWAGSGSVFHVVVVVALVTAGSTWAVRVTE